MTEYEAVNQNAGVADLSHHHSRWQVGGADRARFLHGQCTNDIMRMKPGEACYAAFLTAKGKMRGDAVIVCRQDDFLLVSGAANAAALRLSLEKFIISEEVTIEEVSGRWGELTLQGRRAAEIAGQLESPELMVHADHWIAPGGVTVLAPAGRVGGLLEQAVQAGATRIGEPTLELLRVEAGRPRFGADMDENTIPVEAGLESRAISYEKGCYIGQETIARIRTYGHVNRHLVQMLLAGNATPSPGTAVVAGEREVGRVTSAVMSPRHGRALALGYVRRELAKPGATVRVGSTQAEVIQVCGQ
jgi:folate-binding protein YgfZ